MSENNMSENKIIIANNAVFNSHSVDLQIMGARPKTCYGTGVEEG